MVAPRRLAFFDSWPIPFAPALDCDRILLRATRQGPQVMAVYADSSASKARIQKGDIVFRIGATDVSTPDEVKRAIHSLNPCVQFKLAIRRDGKRTTITATL